MTQPTLFTTSPRFDGADYEPARDQQRLTRQLDRIRRVMADGRWRTLEEISALTGDPAPSVSAQLRHLRKPRFGAHDVQRQHVRNGLNVYRVATLAEDIREVR